MGKLQKHLDRFDAKIGIEKTDGANPFDKNVFRGSYAYQVDERQKELDVSFSEMKFEGERIEKIN